MSETTVRTRRRRAARRLGGSTTIAVDPFYAQALLQANVWFVASVLAAFVGLVVIVWEVVEVSTQPALDAALKVASGLLTETIAALFYGQANASSKHAADLLSRTQGDRRSETALTILNSIQDGALRDDIAARLAMLVACATADNHRNPAACRASDKRYPHRGGLLRTLAQSLKWGREDHHGGAGQRWHGQVRGTTDAQQPTDTLMDHLIPLGTGGTVTATPGSREAACAARNRLPAARPNTYHAAGMAGSDRNGHPANHHQARLALGILRELGSACRAILAASEAARAEEQDLVHVAYDAGLSLPAKELNDLYWRLADRKVEQLEQAYAGWAAWYAATATELLVSRASGRPLRPDVVHRWEALAKGGRDACPELPRDEQVQLGIEALDRAVGDALAMVRRARDADLQAEALGRKLGELREREGVDSKQVRRVSKRVRALEEEAMELAERLYDYGRTVEAALGSAMALHQA